MFIRVDKVQDKAVKNAFKEIEFELNRIDSKGVTSGVDSVFGRSGVVIFTDAEVKESIEIDASELHLIGDVASPGNNQVYGTDGSGNRVWKADPGGGGITSLPDLNDVASAAITNRFALMADGSAYVGRAIIEADISNLQSYSLPGHTHLLSEVTDSGALAALNTVGAVEIDDDAVTYVKIQNVSATDRILGRDSAGAGIVEEITPAALRAMINVADGANNYSHPNHSGDVISVGDGAQTIAINVVSLAKMADMATDSFLGRDTAATGDPEVLSMSLARTMLNVEDGAAADQTANEIEALINHDNLIGFVGDEHIDWSISGAEDIHVARLNLADRLSFGNVLNIKATSAGIRRFYDIASYATPLTDASNYTNIIQFRDADDTDTLGTIGFSTAGQLDIKSLIRGAKFTLKLLGDSGGQRTMIVVDPEGAVDLRYIGTSVARTLPAASGGLEVNNADTGGGFERVLTTGDILSAPIDSVFGRTGNIIAKIGDYAGIAETYTALEIFEGGLTVKNLGTKEFRLKAGAVEYDFRIVGNQLRLTNLNGTGWRFAGDTVEIVTNTGGALFKILGPGALDNMQFDHDDTNARIQFFQTTDLQLGTGLSGVVAMKAPINMEDRLFSRAELKDYALTKHNETSSAGVLTIDMSLGNSVQYTFTENVTSVVITNPPASGKHGEIWLRLVQHASVPKTIVHASKYHFPDGIDHVMTAVNSAVDILHYVTLDGGTTYDCTFVKDSK